MHNPKQFYNICYSLKQLSKRFLNMLMVSRLNQLLLLVCNVSMAKMFGMWFKKFVRTFVLRLQMTVKLIDC